MKQELKDKWVAALESGEYAQGQHVLRSAEDKFCCLGVLLTEAGIDCELVRGRWEFQKQSATLPFNSRFGLSTAAERLLMAMNDGDQPFPEIAKWIRENVEVTE